MLRALLFAVATVLAPAAALADRPIASFAPGQLRVAESLLEQARQAMAQGDHQRARQLAAQAARDARLAYGMSDSPFLRRDAVQVHEESAHLRFRTHRASAGAPR